MQECLLVIAAYDEEARIASCLDSLLEAALPEDFRWSEWVLLDGGSSDGTLSIARDWARWSEEAPPLRMLTSPARRGKALDLNALHEELIDAGRLNEVVVVCDADVVLEPEALKALLLSFAESPSAAVAWGLPLPDRRGIGTLASAFQMTLTAELVRAAGPYAIRSEGRLFAYRLGALAEFRWRSGWVADDTQVADFVAARGLEARTASGAVALTTPAGSYLDFYRQTYRYYAARAKARALGSTHGQMERKPMAAVALHAALADPSGAAAYVVARFVSSVRHRLSPIRFDDAWEPAPTTKETRVIQRGGQPTLGNILRPRTLAIRIGQSVRTVRAFKNWPIVVLRSFLSYVVGPGHDLVVRTRSGLVVRCPNDPRDRAPIFEVLMDDVYRLGGLEELDPEPLVILDVGAQIGAFALEVARRFPSCRVWCFEPNPRVTAYLRRNIRDNDMIDRIAVEQLAVGAVPGLAGLYEAGASSTIVPGLRSKISTPATEVQVVGFEEVMSRLGNKADLVKLDCEGSEYSIVLETAAEAWRGVDRLLLEYEEPLAGRSWRVLRKRLEALGFELRWHERRPDEPDVGMVYLVRRSAGSRRDNAPPALSGQSGSGPSTLVEDRSREAS
jgi:FkbM family methyltransferase